MNDFERQIVGLTTASTIWVAAALGVGGYASGPMMLAAILRGVPSVLFEPNVQPGFTNGVLGRLVRRVAVAHEETARRWAKWCAASASAR